MPNRSRATIREVAALAGVSHQTVSRVINGSERVNPETQAKVESAIAQLGYSPNAIAQFMAKGSTRTLACLSPNLTDYTFASIIEGAETEARQHGYFLISASAPEEEAFDTLVQQLVPSRRTDGLLVINPYADGRHRRLPKNVPTVFLGARPRNERASSVSLDDESAANTATHYLVRLGHRRIAQITGPECEDCTQDRKAGYAAALQAVGISLDGTLTAEGDWSATSGYEAMRRWLDLSVPFTALFAQNDRMAVGAIRALREAGLRVPEDVSVVGFDDMPLASYFDPPLTTVRQDTFLMGREAVRMLIRSIEEAETPHNNLRLPGELVIRSSTAAVRSEDAPR